MRSRIALQRVSRVFSTVVDAARSSQVTSWSGARQVNIAGGQSSTSAPLLFANLSARLASFADNESVGLVAFSSIDGQYFSQHLQHDHANMKALNSFSEQLLVYPKDTIVYVEGDATSSSFGPFAACKYRLGTESTRLVLDDFSKGQLPIGGGLSSRLVGTKRDGVAMARYLVSAQVALSAMDMFKFGLLTHIVPEGSLDIVLPVVGEVACLDLSKASQPRSDKIDSLGELLDSMHVDIKQLGGVFTHNVWSKIVLVTPSQYITEEPTEEDIRDSVVHCFSQDDPDECLKRLELLAADSSHKNQIWAQQTLAVLRTNDTNLMKAWFKFTRYVAKKPLSQVMQLEEQLVATK